jgi:hypothetical protein
MKKKPKKLYCHCFYTYFNIEEAIIKKKAEKMPTYQTRGKGTDKLGKRYWKTGKKVLPLSTFGDSLIPDTTEVVDASLICQP